MPSFKEIAEITSGRIINFYQDLPVEYLLLDTRKITSATSSLFFAIRGERHDGHKFLKEAFTAGVRQFVVENSAEIPADFLPLANFVEVNSAVEALQQLAISHRKQFSIPVIAVGGSNGKTIVKEWLSQLLAKDFHLVKSPKSYNSQVGVPLSVWEMNPQHNFAIFEAGISKPGEMERLEKIIQPTMGIFTNIGPAHDEGFENIQQKIQEKLKLFTHVNTLFYCRDYQILDDVIQNQSHRFSIFSWSLTQKESNVYVKKIDKLFDQTRIHLIFNEEKVLLLCPFKDDASIENLMHCIACLIYLKVPFSEIQRRILLLQPVAMRLELKQGINGSYLIDDTYNNDISGLAMALNFLAQQNLKKGKTLILSDVLEAGKSEIEIYTTISKMIQEKGIQKFIGIGEGMLRHAHLFKNSQFFESTESFIRQFNPKEFFSETILLKGARKFEFEKIVKLLVQKVHGTVLHINLDALSSNLNFYRSQLHSSTKIMVMVKAFAYGSGSYEVANLLQFHRVDYLGVAYADEGVGLRQNGIQTPIMVMNPSAESFNSLLEYDLEPEIYSFKILKEFLEYLVQNNKQARVHVKLDTGMRRLGFLPEEIDSLLLKLKSTHLLTIVSVFTHLAGAEEAQHNDFSMKQLVTFQAMAEKIEHSLGYTVIKHGLNSAGILRFPNLQMDMVRLGIGLYGIETNNLKQGQLQTVGTLKTIISQIKKIPAGETIGYSRKGVLDHDAEIAVIAIGYADGYSRHFGQGVGKIWVNGKICKTVGNICMDMTMVDVTGSEAKEGDEVILFGKEISVSELAKSIGTIPYEILTGVNERVKRVFYTE